MMRGHGHSIGVICEFFLLGRLSLQPSARCWGRDVKVSGRMGYIKNGSTNVDLK